MVENLPQESLPDTHMSPRSPLFSRIFYAAVIILLFILVGLGGYYLGKRSLNSERLAESAVSNSKNEAAINSGIKTFKNDNIQLSYSPERFNFSYEIFNTFPERSPDKQTQMITLSSKDNMNVRLVIKINMDGLGGVCSDFPESYRLEPFTLDGVDVFKAKYVGKEDDPPSKRYNPNWPVGNIYLVMDHSSCPNVAGLQSTKNGPAWIEYDLGAAVSDIDSQAYSEIEKELDQIVSSIKGFW